MEHNTELNEKEAPTGFYAVLKEKVSKEGKNICSFCDARKLCQQNKDNWCLENRCMSYDIVAEKDGKIYARKDRKSVIFKKL